MTTISRTRVSAKHASVLERGSNRKKILDTGKSFNLVFLSLHHRSSYSVVRLRGTLTE